MTIAPYSISINRLMSHFFKVLHYPTNHSERVSVSVYSTLCIALATHNLFTRSALHKLCTIASR